MEIVRRVHSMKDIVRQARATGRKIGLVPTMGSLHAGHLGLVRRVKEVDVVVVSIFVNPAQFGPHEDFATYPRDLTRDADLCVAEGVDYIFAPEAAEMYGRGACTFVEVDEMSSVLEGESRPGHFRGVTTVVLKLFEIVKPHVSCFGQKDAQQAVIIQRMVRDLMLDVEVLVVPTARDDDGLARSSRNVYLSDEARRAAGAIPRALREVTGLVAAGERNPGVLIERVKAILASEPLLETDYVAVVDAATLRPVDEIIADVLLAIAVYAESTRLIDNTVLRV